MRDEDLLQHELLSYGSLEERMPADHPLRPIRSMVDKALKALDSRFDETDGEDGRKSIPPERLLRALLLQMFYTIRSERILIEQLDYNLLFQWFVGLEMDDPVSNHAVFNKNGTVLFLSADRQSRTIHTENVQRLPAPRFAACAPSGIIFRRSLHSASRSPFICSGSSPGASFVALHYNQ
jgi:transposase